MNSVNFTAVSNKIYSLSTFYVLLLHHVKGEKISLAFVRFPFSRFSFIYVYCDFYIYIYLNVSPNILLGSIINFIRLRDQEISYLILFLSN
jgi:hypothetical protein